MRQILISVFARLRLKPNTMELCTTQEAPYFALPTPASGSTTPRYHSLFLILEDRVYEGGAREPQEGWRLIRRTFGPT